MPKRITYLQKREGMQMDAFSTHWSTVHADIARGLPGVIAYVQNHVQQAFSFSPEDYKYSVDGVVELWFADQSVVQAGYESDVASQLASDEINFLSGLTGGPVESEQPHDLWPHKLWVLGRWHHREATSQEAVRSWVSRLIADWPGALGLSINFLTPGAELLTRQALRSEPLIPEVAIAIGFAEAPSVADAATRIKERLGEIEGTLEKLQGYLAEEIVVV